MPPSRGSERPSQLKHNITTALVWTQTGSTTSQPSEIHFIIGMQMLISTQLFDIARNIVTGAGAGVSTIVCQYNNREYVCISVFISLALVLHFQGKKKYFRTKDCQKYYLSFNFILEDS